MDIEKEKRTFGQNKHQWPILQAFSSQVMWKVDGELTYMSADDWKDVLTAAYQRQSRVALGLDGGIVVLGARTRDFKKEKWDEWIEFLNYVSAEYGVRVPVSKNFKE